MCVCLSLFNIVVLCTMVSLEVMITLYKKIFSSLVFKDFYVETLSF